MMICRRRLFFRDVSLTYFEPHCYLRPNAMIRIGRRRSMFTPPVLCKWRTIKSEAAEVECARRRGARSAGAAPSAGGCICPGAGRPLPRRPAAPASAGGGTRAGPGGSSGATDRRQRRRAGPDRSRAENTRRRRTAPASGAGWGGGGAGRGRQGGPGWAGRRRGGAGRRRAVPGPFPGCRVRGAAAPANLPTRGAGAGNGGGAAVSFAARHQGLFRFLGCRRLGFCCEPVREIIWLVVSLSL
jgi:hypothetical protein